MRIVGNILWLVFGGLWLAIVYVLAGIISFVFIITIPFGKQAFKLAGYALWPFGRVVVSKKHHHLIGVATVGNILWMVLAGIWLALGHVVAALLNAVTIIGIPFAVAHLKLARIALTPFGHEVVSLHEAEERGDRHVHVEQIGR
jgi:uncharacterized membrane protein YccF (DUF307 family)